MRLLARLYCSHDIAHICSWMPVTSPSVCCSSFHTDMVAWIRGRSRLHPLNSASFLSHDHSVHHTHPSYCSGWRTVPVEKSGHKFLVHKYLLTCFYSKSYQLRLGLVHLTQHTMTRVGTVGPGHPYKHVASCLSMVSYRSFFCRLVWAIVFLQHGDLKAAICFLKKKLDGFNRAGNGPGSKHEVVFLKSIIAGWNISIN